MGDGCEGIIKLDEVLQEGAVRSGGGWRQSTGEPAGASSVKLVEEQI